MEIILVDEMELILVDEMELILVFLILCWLLYTVFTHQNSNITQIKRECDNEQQTVIPNVMDLAYFVLLFVMHQ
jgi:hypothetical protein